MKTVLKSLFVTLACYIVFMSGYNYNDYEVHTVVRKCSDIEITVNEDLHKFYGHESIEGNLWNHAEAIVEYNWAKCFREELYK